MQFMKSYKTRRVYIANSYNLPNQSDKISLSEIQFNKVSQGFIQQHQ